jgi:hypothetical protein
MRPAHSGFGPTGSWAPVGSVGSGDVEDGQPRRDPRWVLVAMASLLALVLLVLLAEPDDGLSTLRAVGTRGPVCDRFIALVDQSGSMSDQAEARDAADRQLRPWMLRNLRADDEYAVVDFAESAEVRLPPTRVDRLADVDGGRPAAVVQGGYTLLAPPLAAVRSMATTECDVNLLLLSDGQLVDLPADATTGRRMLLDSGVHDLHLLVPSESVGDPPPQWAVGFPDIVPSRFNGLDAEETSVAVADAVAAGTGQVLVRQPGPADPANP